MIRDIAKQTISRITHRVRKREHGKPAYLPQIQDKVSVLRFHRLYFGPWNVCVMRIGDLATYLAALSGRRYRGRLPLQLGEGPQVAEVGYHYRGRPRRPLPLHQHGEVAVDPRNTGDLTCARLGSPAVRDHSPRPTVIEGSEGRQSDRTGPREARRRGKISRASLNSRAQPWAWDVFLPSHSARLAMGTEADRLPMINRYRSGDSHDR